MDVPPGSRDIVTIQFLLAFGEVGPVTFPVTRRDKRGRGVTKIGYEGPKSQNGKRAVSGQPVVTNAELPRPEVIPSEV